MIGALRNVFWNLRYPWPRTAIDGRIQPLRFSVCEPARFSDCLRLHEANEDHGVPHCHRPIYSKLLHSRRVLTILAETESGVVGTFGIQYWPTPDMMSLCYMLVSPSEHRRGIGTTMFMASLALLPDDHSDISVLISALPTAVEFYDRFGFERIGEHLDPGGEMHQLAVLRPVTSAMIAGCRSMLMEAGATLPKTCYAIPSPNTA